MHFSLLFLVNNINNCNNNLEYHNDYDDHTACKLHTRNINFFITLENAKHKKREDRCSFHSILEDNTTRLLINGYVEHNTCSVST